jgi:hypothetical protein
MKLFGVRLMINAATDSRLAESPGLSDLPMNTQNLLRPYENAVLRLGSDLWEFSIDPNGAAGVRIVVTSGTDSNEECLSFGKAERAVGIVAAGKAAPEAMIALGVVSAADGDQLEYRILFSYPAVPDEKRWLRSDPLIIEPIDAPFEIMSIALPEGDTIVLTLQRYRRIHKGVALEVHQFLHQCPTPPPERFTKTFFYGAKSQVVWHDTQPPIHSCPLDLE